MTDAPAVTGQLKDLGTLNLGALPSLLDPALAEMLERVVRRLDKPGTAISGYNGAGGAPIPSPLLLRWLSVELSAGDDGDGVLWL